MLPGSTKDDMMNFHNADIDAKFSEAATTLDDSKRKELYSELQVLVAEEALQYPMGTSMKTVVTNARVGGLDDAQFVPIYTFGDVSKLTLKKWMTGRRVNKPPPFFSRNYIWRKRNEIYCKTYFTGNSITAYHYIYLLYADQSCAV